MRYACDLSAAALLAVALWVALGTVSGLTWPYDGDHFRDIAQVQTTLNGHPLSDPYYAGEWVWYNPLLPWLLAVVSLVTGATAALAHVQGGPWLNLLGPISFYLLAARLAGRPAALLALFLLVFVNCRTDPALTCATYSPWLFVATFSQALFFLGVIALDAAVAADTDLAAAGLGALAGLTFLAHTGPALVLGATAAVMLPPRRLLLAGAVAALVASPFLVSIIGHYHLHIVNDAPVAWAWAPTSRGGIGATLGANAPLLIAGLAGTFVVRRRIGYAWLGTAVLFTLYGLIREGTELPSFVPTFHFWRYTMAAATLFAGAAGAWLLERLARQFTVVILPVLIAILAIWLLPQYRLRFDFVYGKSIAEGRSADLSDTASFLRKSLPRDAVVLGSRGLTLEVIAPAGHHVVGVNANWSNPYIPNGPRVAARDEMLEAVHARRADAFFAQADRFGVTHAVGLGAAECDDMTAIGLQLLYRFGEACVFARGTDPMR